TNCIALGFVGLNQSHLLVHGAASGRAHVTGGTANALEQLVALQFGGGQSFVIAFQPLVETRVRGHQSLFKNGDGIGDALKIYLAVTVYRFKLIHVLGNGADYVHSHVVAESHFNRVGDGACSLLLKISSATVPELRY